jgi:hypothetical protein
VKGGERLPNLVGRGSRKATIFIRELRMSKYTWRVGTKDAPSRGLSLGHGSARQSTKLTGFRQFALVKP